MVACAANKFLTGAHEARLVGEVAQDSAILQSCLSKLALFAVTFSQAKYSRREHLAIGNQIGQRLAIVVNGRVQLMMGFFFEQAALVGSNRLTVTRPGQKN